MADPIKMTRAEYQAKFGTAPAVASAPTVTTPTIDTTTTPVKMTRAEYTAKFGTAPETTSTTPQKSGMPYIPGVSELANVGVGIGSAIGKTVFGIPEAISRLGGGAARTLGFQGYGDALTQNADKIKALKEGIYQKPFEEQLKTVPGQIGNVVGNVLPYFATGGGTGLAEAASLASRAVPAITRAITSALVAGAQSGGDLKTMGAVGLTSAVANAVVPGSGGFISKTLKTGTAPGYLDDVSMGLAGQRGEDRTGAKAFIPGLGTALGTTLAAGSNVNFKPAGDFIKSRAGAFSSTAKELHQKVTSTIEDFGTKIKQPDVTSATAVSLNPKKALMGSGQDIQVSVGGKLKKLSQVTPKEYERMQLSTEKSLSNFNKEAELYKNNRNPLNDPTEIVGQRVDKALAFADKKRQFIGQKMGAIETKYVNDKLPIGQKANSAFVETIKSFDNPKFGVDTANAGTVRKLVEDFDTLEKGGATIGDRLDFVRAWDRYLNDAKDAFGNFKENATANTRIQNAIRVLKNETVDAVALKDTVYRKLRTQYSTYKKLNEIGDSLLGKEGMLGDKIKGGATVKRAIMSNSDAGSRQFLTKLKELTGYDSIKDADLALTAMENVGDFQGLSLLKIIKEGKGGIINKVLEKGQDMLVGNKTERINNYIKPTQKTNFGR